ncbi:MAG: hypothetical protein AB1649_03450 [Chloroflexota bacterium]
MSSTIKHLSLGLLIGLVTAALIISGLIYLGASATPEPVISLPSILQSATFTHTPVPLTSTTTNTPASTFFPPSRTNTPTPSATLTALDQLLASGQIAFGGPLSPDQQIRLYVSSLEFIAPTTRQAKQVGVTINGVGYGSPSLICGPLSLAVLQNAGLIEDEQVIPFDFWLLNPYISQGRALLNRVFPADQYENNLIETPLNKFDWTAYPLQPGDFLYIRHGSWGNFDHMLVVTRVDNLGRRYAVTNFNTPDGFIIDEALLYDPNDRKTGLFHTWTKAAYSSQGATGFGGFESWRRRPP